MIHVLVADDHPVYRSGLAALIRDAPATELVGTAGDGGQAVELARSEHPDVVLMDVRMPGLNGIEATSRIVGESPDTNVLILSMFDDDDFVFAALRAGARGYILKEASGPEILHAIESVAAGEAILGAGVADRLRQFFSAPAPPEPFPELTERERAILELIAQGHSNHEIATRYTLSEKTVRNYVSNILTKLHVAHRAQAIVRAREAGLGLSGSGSPRAAGG
jgi:DNA-binding NarL/FixJ family response regulator